MRCSIASVRVTALHLKGLLVFLVAFGQIAGCSTTFRETHFFKSESRSGEVPNYFRLVVSGHTGMSSARYLSGYFDEDVVNLYFNEIGQPGSARLIPVTAAGSGNGDSKSPQNLRNPALVLILSTNSDDIANQIGALTQSKEFTASLARLVGASRFEAAETAELRNRSDENRGRAEATLGDQLVLGLPEKPTAQEVQARLLEFANQLSTDLGAPAQFNSLDEAATWLQANRTRLQRENRP